MSTTTPAPAMPAAMRATAARRCAERALERMSTCTLPALKSAGCPSDLEDMSAYTGTLKHLTDAHLMGARLQHARAYMDYSASTEDRQHAARSLALIQAEIERRAALN